MAASPTDMLSHIFTGLAAVLLPLQQISPKKMKQIHLSIQQYNNSYLRLNSNNILFHSHYLHNNNYLPKSVPPALLVV